MPGVIHLNNSVKQQQLLYDHCTTETPPVLAEVLRLVILKCLPVIRHVLHSAGMQKNILILQIYYAEWPNVESYCCIVINNALMCELHFIAAAGKEEAC